VLVLRFGETLSEPQIYTSSEVFGYVTAYGGDRWAFGEGPKLCTNRGRGANNWQGRLVLGAHESLLNSFVAAKRHVVLRHGRLAEQ